MIRTRPIANLILLVLLIIGCSDADPTTTPAPLATNAPTPTTAPTEAPISIDTAAPAPTQPPTAIAPTLPSALSPIDIYAAVAPSVAMVETDIAFGSSVLVEGGYLVTNAHVVWPYSEARIVFSDGSEFENVPMIGWDLLNDLAVLGPIETDLPVLALDDGEALPVGSDVYLIGFPGEVDQFPQASITRGLISRYREWELEGVTYFQTDAEIAGGQSGGVLVSQLGKVIGISGFSFTETDFGVVASTTDVAAKIEALIDGDDAAVGVRLFPTDGGMDEVRVTLLNDWDSANFIVFGEVDEDWEVTLDGRADGAIAAYDVDGVEVLFADEEVEGVESAETTLESDAPHFLQIYTFDSGRSVFNIESNIDLIPLDDPDDLTPITIGSTYRGNLDYPGDFDTLVIDLEDGQEINILVDSVLVDPFISVRAVDGSDESVTDDDAGGGLFGVSAELTYQATQDGKHFIIIESAFGDEYGGYIAQIGQPDADSPTPIAPEPTATPRPPLNLDFGKLALYRSATSAFEMRYPATWSNDISDDSLPLDACESVDACFANEDGVLSISEADISNLPDDITLDGYTKIVVDELEALGDEFNLLSSERFITNSGLDGVQIVYEFTGLFTVYRAIVITEDFQAFNPSYIFFENAADYADLAIDTFKTIAVGE